MNPDNIVQTLQEDLQKSHGCHTVILYGSRARGDHTADSDYDVAGFGPIDTMIRDARFWNGSFLDIFIYPESCLAEPGPELLKMRGGIVMVEKNSMGTLFLQALEELYAAGAPRLPDDEAQARRVWATKMLERAKRGDVEGNFRRAWLLTALLEDYFSLRGLWYLGPKASFEWLRQHDIAAYEAFAAALKPAAGLELIASAVTLAIGDAPDIR